MSFFSFFKRSLLLLFFCAMVGYIAFTIGDISQSALIWGIGIGYGNVLVGFPILRWGFDKPHKYFLLSVYGGMILRFLLIFSLIFILIVAFKMEMVTFLVSLMGSYFLFLGLEVYQFSQIADTRRNSQ